MSEFLNIYDMNRRKTAVLHNAFDITETQELNKIYTLEFSIPSTDEKTQYLQPFHYVRYGDTGQLYRIIKSDLQDGDTGVLNISCEHVIATLCDDLMFGAKQYGGGTIRTAMVINWLLNQQTTKNWILAACDFDRRFEYLWEQENILNALYSIPKEFSKAYKWTFDTTTYPWRLSLKAIDETIHPEYYIRAKRNMLSSGTAQDFADICTRIYPLGYGEGVNQMTIKEAKVTGIRKVNGVAVNATVDTTSTTKYGNTYIQSPDEIVALYGIKQKVLVDRRFEDPNSLFSYAQTTLEALQVPSMSRQFDVVDLYPLTSQDIDNAEPGKICKMTGDDTIAYVTKTVRVLDDPGNLQINLSTKATDVASTIADLADRVRIESVYAQGATQLYQHSKDDNATSEKGSVLNLYFPEEMRQINKVLLKVQLDKFRSYSKTESAYYNVGTKYTEEDGSVKNFMTTGTDGSVKNFSTSGNDGGKTGFATTGNDGGKTGFATTGNDGGKTGFYTTGNDGGKENFATSGEDGGKTGFATTGNDGGKKNFATSGEDGGKTGFATTGNDGGKDGLSTVEGGRVDTESGISGGGTGTTSVASGGGGISLSVSVDISNLSIDVDKTSDAFWTKQGTIPTNKVYVVDDEHGETMLKTSETGSHQHTLQGYVDTVTPLENRQYAHTHYLRSYGGGNAYMDSAGSHSHSIYDNTGHSHGITRDDLKHYHSASFSGSVSGSADITNTESGMSGFSHSHNFSIAGHKHTFSMPAHKHTFNLPNHKHTFDLPNHKHTFNLPNHKHTFDLPNHKHTFDLPNHKHTFDLPNHKHTFDTPNHKHKIEIGQHAHDITPGIFEDTKNNSTAFDIYVNGTKKQTINAKTWEGDITQWLLNDKNQVPRDSWIKVEIRPNNLAYVISSVFVQGFVQSRGGGNY